MQTTTATSTATAPATGAADTTVAGIGTPTDVAAVLARLTQVTDQLAATIHTHTTNGNDSDSDGVVRVGMPTAGAILTATDRLTATVITVLASLSHRGVIADEGISAEAWLRTFAARTAADERMLSNTVDRLADMPTISQWFSTGDLSWPVVRGIVAAVRNLTREQRRWVDRTITADPDRTRRLDPDDLVAAVQQLADRARPDLHRDRERRAVERDRVYCQDGFDGSSYGSWELGPESAELLRRALFDTNPNHHTTTRDNDRDATNDTGHSHAGDTGHGHTDTGDASHRPADTNGDHADTNGDHHHDSDTDTTDSDSDDGHLSGHDADGGDVSDGDSAAAVELEDEDGGEFTGADRWRHRREWTNAQALLALCRQRLGEPGGSAPPPARPSMLVIVDIDALTDNHPDGVGSATAQLLTRSTRGPVELTPAAAQRLACDATTRYVLVDGAIPLGATAAEPKVSATLRAALVARRRLRGSRSGCLPLPPTCAHCLPGWGCRFSGPNSSKQITTVGSPSPGSTVPSAIAYSSRMRLCLASKSGSLDCLNVVIA